MKNTTFGFSRDSALLYSLDNYSTPDNWQGLGYELQYELVVFFSKIIREVERMEFLLLIWDVFSHSFCLPQERVAMGIISDERLSDILENAFSTPLDTGNKMQPPFDMIRGIQYRVLWHSGRLDLRLLNRLENELNSVAAVNHAWIFLANLIIIPRSPETMAKKISEISGSHK
jgi:hypothetical protein